jgi:hypothetical protein
MAVLGHPALQYPNLKSSQESTQPAGWKLKQGARGTQNNMARRTDPLNATHLKVRLMEKTIT